MLFTNLSLEMVLNFLLAVSNVLALSETRRSGAPRSLTKRSRARQKSFEFKELVALVDDTEE